MLFLSVLVLVIVLSVLQQTVSSKAAAPSLLELITPVEPVNDPTALPLLQKLALKPNYMLMQGGTTASSLVGEWRFDEASGASAADSSGRSLHGTLQNGAAWSSGRYRAGLRFDGVNDFVQVGTPPALVMTNAMSLSAWIYPTGTGPAGLGCIINKEGEYEIARFSDGTIRWAFANSAPGWNFIDTGFVAPQNQWTHLALTYNNGEVKTYANGNLVHSYAGTGAIGDVGCAHGIAGERDRALAVLNELLEARKTRYIQPQNIAIVYIGLGDFDSAFEWLDRAFGDRCGPLTFLKVWPFMDRLRSDPRYDELMQRLGLPL